MDNADVILTEKSFNFGFPDLLAGMSEGNEKINSCIQCGSCTGSCLAAEGMPLSPRKLWRSLQLGLEPEALGSASFWSCTTCGLCDKRCPRGIPMSRLMLDLRERYGLENDAPEGVSRTMANLEKTGNITGDEQRNRFLWLDNLLLPERGRLSLFRSKSEVVYMTGCVGALFPQVGGIPQSLTRLLLKLETDFSLLEDEWCCGYPVMAGGKGLANAADYAMHNISAITAKGAKTVIVSCPTCYYMLTKVYPGLTGAPLPFRTLHYTEYLCSLPGLSGPGDFQRPGLSGAGGETVVTYHDPCDLSRKLQITEPPRELLRGLSGVSLREMRFSRGESKCCGGGGNLEMADPSLAADIAARRIGDAVAVGAEYLLSSCQQCKRTLQNAARKARARIKVQDLLEFLVERVGAQEKERLH